MKKLVLPVLCLLMVGGCVGANSGASEVDASTSARRTQDDDRDQAPRQVCQDTSIGGTPKSFCY